MALAPRAPGAPDGRAFVLTPAARPLARMRRVQQYVQQPADRTGGSYWMAASTVGVQLTPIGLDDPAGPGTWPESLDRGLHPSQKHPHTTTCLLWLDIASDDILQLDAKL
jgi:hypothetical protein